MKKYQGIGPAVDMHLARFAEAEREVANARAVMATRDPVSQQRLVSMAWGREWASFSATYGITGADGKPQVQYLQTSDGEITSRRQVDSASAAIVQGAHMGLREHAMLSKAVSHYVSGEIVDEVTEAASLIEPEPIFHTDLFTPYGFALLEKPLVVSDLDNDTGTVSETQTIHVRAFAWSIEQMGAMDPTDTTMYPGVTLWIYSTTADLAQTGLAGVPFEGFPYPDDHLIPLEVAPWSFGKSWQVHDSRESVPGFIPVPVAYERRWFLAFMRLCWQQVIVRHPHHPDRAQHRRWERLSKRKELLDYTVLRLRREVDPNYRPMGDGVPLDHRVVVRGHWKQQFFPSLGDARLDDGAMNPESHRWIWVERHIRGHEFLPMGATHSATSVVR